MILPFSTMLNGKPTYFVEKILKGLADVSASDTDKEILRKATELGYFQFEAYDEVYQKIHTIRVDENKRWQPGVMIDFFINSRQPNMFRFAPRRPCIETHEIVIEDDKKGGVDIFIDNRKLLLYECDDLIKNDGFNGYEDFKAYFISQMKDGVFKGKIIHWTGKRY